MKDCFRVSLLAAIFVTVGRSGVAGTTHQSPPEETVCVHLYNFAHIQPQTVKYATLQTTRIFTKAGIGITWMQPPAGSPEAHWLDLNTSASGTRSRERPCLVVRLVKSLPFAAYSGALGFANPYARFGVDVEIIYERLQFHAMSAGVADHVLLACAMAHEIGHVLLRSSAHAPAGIMRPYWDDDAWRLASFGMVAFLPKQAKQMRQELRQLGVEDRHP